MLAADVHREHVDPDRERLSATQELVVAVAAQLRGRDVAFQPRLLERLACRLLVRRHASLGPTLGQHPAPGLPRGDQEHHQPSVLGRGHRQGGILLAPTTLDRNGSFSLTTGSDNLAGQLGRLMAAVARGGQRPPRSAILDVVWYWVNSNANPTSACPLRPRTPRPSPPPGRIAFSSHGLAPRNPSTTDRAQSV